MGAMTRVMLAAAVAAMMPAISNAAVLWDFDTETGVSVAFSSGQGITAESHDLVSSPKTQGTSAARVQIDKNPGSMPSVSYRVARTWEDLTDATISFDVYVEPNDMVLFIDINMFDGNWQQEWKPAAPTAGQWNTITLTENVGTSYRDGSFNPSSVDQVWFGFRMTANAQSAGTIYFDNFVLVPEPVTLAMLAIGAAGMLRRRRR